MTCVANSLTSAARPAYKTLSWCQAIHKSLDIVFPGSRRETLCVAGAEGAHWQRRWGVLQLARRAGVAPLPGARVYSVRAIAMPFDGDVGRKKTCGHKYPKTRSLATLSFCRRRAHLSARALALLPLRKASSWRRPLERRDFFVYFIFLPFFFVSSSSLHEQAASALCRRVETTGFDARVGRRRLVTPPGALFSSARKKRSF